MKAFPRDIEVQTMKVRHIGVENELGVKTSLSNFQDAISRHGMLQSVGWDGGGREFRTNPISVRSLEQVRGTKYLAEYYSILKEHTEVLDTGGTHIHISILNSDNPNMEVNAAALATAFFDQFQKIAGRKTHWAGRLNHRNVDTLKRDIESRKYPKGQRTYAMKGSILAPTGHQTLEFRGPKGSNDSTEVFAWVEFLNNVVKASNRNCVDGIKFGDLLKGNRLAEYLKSLSGWRKLTTDDLNKQFNGASL